MAVVFESKRLLIANFEQSDFVFWNKIHNLKDITKFTMDHRYKTSDEIELDFYQNLKLRKLKRWKILSKETLTPIGLCGFKKYKSHFHLGFRILKTYRNKEYATEAAKACLDFAFKSTNYPKIMAYCVDENTASKKVLKKCNFIFSKKLYDKDIVWLKFELLRGE